MNVRKAAGVRDAGPDTGPLLVAAIAASASEKYAEKTSIQERLINIVDLDYNERSSVTMEQWDHPDNLEEEAMPSRSFIATSNAGHYGEYLKRMAEDGKKVCSWDGTIFFGL